MAQQGKVSILQGWIACPNVGQIQRDCLTITSEDADGRSKRPCLAAESRFEIRKPSRASVLLLVRNSFARTTARQGRLALPFLPHALFHVDPEVHPHFASSLFR